MAPTTRDLERVEDVAVELRHQQELMRAEFSELRTRMNGFEDRLKVIARVEAVIAVLLSALVTIAGVDLQRTVGVARKILDSGLVGTSTAP